LGRETEREGVDPGELLEDERLALHDGLGAVGPDVAEAEHGGAVRHDGDAVLLDGQRVRLLRILMDGHAHARDDRRVGHREIVAGLDRDLSLHLDLAAEVHEERAIRDVDDANTTDGPDLFHDLLGMTLVTRLDAEIAGDRRLADLDEVDGADVTARLADGRRHLAEHAWLVVDLEAYRDAVTRARSVDHFSSRSARTTAMATILARSEEGVAEDPVEAGPGIVHHDDDVVDLGLTDADGRGRRDRPRRHSAERLQLHRGPGGLGGHSDDPGHGGGDERHARARIDEEARR